MGEGNDTPGHAGAGKPILNRRWLDRPIGAEARADSALLRNLCDEFLPRTREAALNIIRRA